MKKKTLKNDVARMQSVEKLIAENMMMVDARNFQVAMLAELWNLYFDEGKKKLCQNILTYCNVKNSFDGIVELTVSDYGEFVLQDVINSVSGLGKYIIKNGPYTEDDKWYLDVILDNSVLLVSIKDSKNNVEPYAYFKNGVIELIKR
jgi:hypothetical protein